MRLFDAFLCIVCVGLVSIGQVLLRAAVSSGHALSGNPIMRLLSLQTISAIGVYSVAMLLWLYILTRVPLTLAFPFYGLCFLLVPLFSVWVLGESVTLSTWVGGAIIICGICVAIWVR